MADQEISKEAHRIVELMSKDDSKAFLKELQHDQQTMSPQQYAELIKDMAAETKDNRNMQNFPKVTFTEDSQHHITSVKLDRLVLGDEHEQATIDSNGNVTDKRAGVGLVDASSGFVTPWWTNQVEALLKGLVDKLKGDAT